MTSSEQSHITTSPEETVSLGERIGRDLKGGTVIVLIGPLGSGKTTLVRGLAQGLEVFDPKAVKSPSYTLALRYDGPIPLFHLDAYFMRSVEDLELCAMDEALERGEVVVIEWGDKVAARLPEGGVTILLTHRTPDERKIVVRYN